jgi:[FeFe] hydrogenase H-cluster maturation GTPase HydF
MLQATPKGLRLHIGLFGRRNVGKSSLLNAITRQQVSIVSHLAGTTTDPVEKPMELLPLGPVLFIDTAGIDDTGELGDLRVARTRNAFERTDLAVIVTDGQWGAFEESIHIALCELGTPVVAVFNKIDEQPPEDSVVEGLRARKILVVKMAVVQERGIAEFRQALLDSAPKSFVENPTLLGDLVGPGKLAVLVVPIDKEAPKGRLILPQVQAIRDLLDSDAITVVVKERELRAALSCLREPPQLVVTDSQAFLKAEADTPRDIPLTSFSILLSRARGDLMTQTEGVLAIDKLRSGDQVLIAEACSHLPICEDIGRVKIPRWLTQYVGGKLDFTFAQGIDFPVDLSPFKVVIHCGACMWNRRAMLSRLQRCRNAGVPITNYGLAIAHSLGILSRALGPFPAALDVYQRRNSQ